MQGHKLGISEEKLRTVILGNINRNLLKKLRVRSISWLFSNQTIEGLGDMVLSYLFPLKFISFIQLTY